MPQTTDLANKVIARYDALIKSNLETLIAGDASRHDKITGIIAGLGQARKELETEAKRWRLHDEEAA